MIVSKLASYWQPVFPVELFWCGIRQESRRLFLPLMGALSLVLSMLVLMGTYFALLRFGVQGMGGKLLPALTFTVTLDLFIVLGMSVPFALRAATSDDDLPLVMMTGLSPIAIWRAQVWGTALPALFIPVLHLPLIVFVRTMGGVPFSNLAAMGLFWIVAWLIATGWSALAGCMWTGVARDRVQGMSLTLMLVLIYGAGWMVLLRILWLLQWSLPWWKFGSFQPAWSWTESEFVRLGIHLAFAGLAAWVSVIVLRGRWRHAVETGSKDSEHAVTESVTLPVESSPEITPAEPTPVPPQSGRAPSRPRCGNDPWFWKDFHVSGGSWFYWNSRLGVAVLLAVSVALSFGYGVRHRAVEPILFLSFIGWFVWMMFDVGQVLNVEFQDRMWPIARITPNPVSHILWGKLRAFMARLAPSLIPLGLACGLGLTTYAWQMVAYGVPILLLVTIPFAGLVLYGSAIPQNLLGGGWPLLRTTTVFLLGMAAYIALMIFADQSWWIQCLMTVLMSLLSTMWFGYATLKELNNPRRELQSADGG